MTREERDGVLPRAKRRRISISDPSPILNASIYEKTKEICETICQRLSECTDRSRRSLPSDLCHLSFLSRTKKVCLVVKRNLLGEYDNEHEDDNLPPVDQWNVLKTCSVREYVHMKAVEHLSISPMIEKIYDFTPNPKLKMKVLLPYYQPIDKLIHSLTTRQRVVLCVKMAQALTELHQDGFVHRDLRIHNMVWDPKTRKVIIIDFSSLCTVEHSKVHLSGFNMCTGKYAPPEVLLSDLHGQPGDVWSLGVCMVDVFCSTNNFFSQNSDEKKTVIDQMHHPRLMLSHMHHLFPKLCKRDVRFCRYEMDATHDNPQDKYYEWLLKQNMPNTIVDVLRNGIFVWSANERYKARDISDLLFSSLFLRDETNMEE
jgi:serine/threonine protein kinase